MERNAQILKTSVIGIVVNALLAGFKALIGFISGSIAIVLDAVNNLSDAASSLITIIGTKLASKRPDKKHPFGYGRIEYLSAMIIAIIIMYAGITSLIESIKKIINPQVPEYNLISIIIIGTAVFAKFFLGRYVKKVGKKVNSSSLINSGQDALLDSIISLSTFVAAIVFMLFKVSLEAYLALIISVIIIKSSIEMLIETVSQILGEKADPELAKSIKATVRSFKDVNGAYDLVLNNYGPDSFNGSIHIEIPDTYTATDLDKLARQITEKVYAEYNIYLTAIGIYSQNTKKDNAALIRDKISSAILKIEHVVQMHGFYIDEELKTIRFDVVISFDSKDCKAVFDKVYETVKSLYPDYEIQLTMDMEY